MNDPSFDLDLMAASLSADSNDVKVLLKALVSKLSGALGDRLKIERTGGFLKRSGEIRGLSVQLGDDQLDVTVKDSTLECTIARISGGIRIRSSKVSIDEWIRHLLGALKVEAATSQATRLALESLVIGGQS